MAAREITLQEPPIARWLFGSTQASWIWLFARVWLGWSWFTSAWGKVFGGTITWRFWQWGDPQYTLTGDRNIGWVRSGTVVAPDGTERTMDVGASVAGFAERGIEAAEGPHPAVAFDFYVRFLEWVRDTAHPVLGPMVAIGELLVGAALILGLFTGIAAFFGLVMNFSFVFGGTAGVNPAFMIGGIFLILAWRNAGWFGLDRILLPKLGTPWQRGELFGGKPPVEIGERDSTEEAAEPGARGGK